MYGAGYDAGLYTRGLIMASKARRGSAWWIRWRERRPDGTWSNRSVTLDVSERDAELARLDIERQLEERGWADTGRLSARPPASLIDGLLALLDARVEAGRWTGNTPSTYRSYVVKLARGIHDVTGISPSQPLPVTLLSRDLFDRVSALWGRAEVSHQSRYGALRLLLEAWRWMSDDPSKWPHVPRPPLSHKDYLPQAPSYVRTEAPTLEHVDAMLRALDRRGQHPETLAFAIVCRYLGWRAGQVAELRLEDVDLGRMQVTIPTGKSRREKEERRVVPLSVRLLEEPGIRALLTRSSSGPVFRGRGHEGVRQWLPDRAFAVAWEYATETEGVPREVWDPPQRRHARPTHALRAAVRSHWLEAGAPREVVDYLVGQAPTSVGDRHYGRPLVEVARTHVDNIPPVEWTASVLTLKAR